jgi:hypothetical protein
VLHPPPQSDNLCVCGVGWGVWGLSVSKLIGTAKVFFDS